MSQASNILFSRISSSLLLVLISLLTIPAYATSEAELTEKYEEIEDSLLENNFGIPIVIESTSNDRHMYGAVYGIIYHPFKTIRNALSVQQNWCEIMPQHLNIKACTWLRNDHCELRFYSGRKFYEKADDVYKLKYNFVITTANERHFHANLTAKEGPIDTEDYLISVEANYLSESSTFIKFSYEYKFGIWTNLAMSTYLSTLGRNKQGFTVTGTDKNGKPEYIDGVRGIIERNSVRYYFAITSFLASLKQPDAQRFTTRINNWFDQTSKYPQLFEMEKAKYLDYKSRERLDQLRLQSLLKIPHGENSESKTPHQATCRPTES